MQALAQDLQDVTGFKFDLLERECEVFDSSDRISFDLGVSKIVELTHAQRLDLKVILKEAIDAYCKSPG
jgi:hypothetical protein